jgi:hypothetical protein
MTELGVGLFSSAPPDIVYTCWLYEQADGDKPSDLLASGPRCAGNASGTPNRVSVMVLAVDDTQSCAMRCSCARAVLENRAVYCRFAVSDFEFFAIQNKKLLVFLVNRI